MKDFEIPDKRMEKLLIDVRSQVLGTKSPNLGKILWEQSQQFGELAQAANDEAIHQLWRVGLGNNGPHVWAVPAKTVTEIYDLVDCAVNEYPGHGNWHYEILQELKRTIELLSWGTCEQADAMRSWITVTSEYEVDVSGSRRCIDLPLAFNVITRNFKGSHKEYALECLLKAGMDKDWIKWNDKPGRTQAEVIALIDRAIVICSHIFIADNLEAYLSALRDSDV